MCSAQIPRERHLACARTCSDECERTYKSELMADMEERYKNSMAFISRQVFARDGYKCLFCGSTDNLAADHIIPKSKGGGNELSNLQTLCKSCNSKKGTKYPYKPTSVGIVQ